MTQYAEQILTDIHNMDIDNKEMQLIDFQDAMRDFTGAELRHLINNLDKIKKLAQQRKRTKRDDAAD